jgi:hypothetical protein
VTNIDKVKTLGQRFGPLFNFWSVNFDCGSTASASQVMVVSVYITTAIESFAPIGHDNIYFAG